MPHELHALLLIAVGVAVLYQLERVLPLLVEALRRREEGRQPPSDTDRRPPPGGAA